MYSGKLLMMGKGDARNMWSFIKNKFGLLVRLVGYLKRNKTSITFTTDLP
jgi:hypothetical protein